MRKFVPLALVALFAAAQPALAGQEVRYPKSLTAMSAADFRSGTVVKDDDLEFHTVLSTEQAHKSGWPLFRMEGGDTHLRAIVDKRTGDTRFEVKQKLQYWGTKRDYTAAHVDAPGGPIRTALTEARHGNDVCPMSENMVECPLSKYLAFEVDESLLRDVAASGKPGWEFKFKDETGHDHRAGLTIAEVSGLLQAVDGYRASRAGVQASAAPVGQLASGM